MDIQLWEHQEVARDLGIASLQRSKKPLLIVPTGGGKTMIAAAMCSAFSGRIIIACCFVSLINQFRDDLILWGHPESSIGILQGDNSDTQEDLTQKRIVIAMVQTLVSDRGTLFLRFNKFGLCIQDEKHLSYLDTAEKLVNAKMNIAMTATPWRGDGSQTLQDDYEWHQPVTMGQLVDRRVLCPFDHYLYDLGPEEYPIPAGEFTPEEETVAVSNIDPGFVLSEWKRIASHLPTLGFCPTIIIAKQYAEFFTRNGVNSEVVSDETSDKDFRNIRKRFRSGTTKVMFSVTKIATGFNEKCAKAILLLRPLKSISLWVQIIGRILRVENGTPQTGVLMDFLNNGTRLPNPLDIEDWRDLPSPKGKTCPTCSKVSGKTKIYCPCGTMLIEPKIKAEIQQQILEPEPFDGYFELRGKLRKIDRNGSVASQVASDAFWNKRCDPSVALVVQKKAGIVPVKPKQGSIFGEEPTPQDFGQYIVYLKPFALERKDPKAWIIYKIKEEFGEQGMEWLKLMS